MRSWVNSIFGPSQNSFTDIESAISSMVPWENTKLCELQVNCVLRNHQPLASELTTKFSHTTMCPMWNLNLGGEQCHISSSPLFSQVLALHRGFAINWERHIKIKEKKWNLELQYTVGTWELVKSLSCIILRFCCISIYHLCKFVNFICRIQYAVVQKAVHNGRRCLLYTYTENGEVIEREFRMISHKAANALYRCITEMHSFFRCDTVNNAVSTQVSRDLKGILASLFHENTTLGKSVSTYQC